jgi:CheY-like chemotaxis protein
MTTVLICDDDDPLRELVRESLADGDYVFAEARDGDEAIASIDAQEPDLVVLDMMMPGRSGLDVLRELRRQPRHAAIPVLMLTARAQAADRDEATAAGATAFLPKPFSPVELAATVSALLDGHA